MGSFSSEESCGSVLTSTTTAFFKVFKNTFDLMTLPQVFWFLFWLSSVLVLIAARCFFFFSFFFFDATPASGWVGGKVNDPGRSWPLSHPVWRRSEWPHVCTHSSSGMNVSAANRTLSGPFPAPHPPEVEEDTPISRIHAVVYRVQSSRGDEYVFFFRFVKITVESSEQCGGETKREANWADLRLAWFITSVHSLIYSK